MEVEKKKKVNESILTVCVSKSDQSHFSAAEPHIFEISYNVLLPQILNADSSSTEISSQQMHYCFLFE